MRHDPTRQAVLQLNASFEPMAFASVRRAAALVLAGKASVEEEHDTLELRPGMMAPIVIRLRRFQYVPRRAKMGRNNILTRDRYQCQYCGGKFHPSQLTLDHVLPRSRGGRGVWENLVACCYDCNQKKDDRTPEEAGMPLLHKPRPSNIHTSRYLMRSIGQDHPKWTRYLYNESDEKFVHRHS